MEQLLIQIQVRLFSSLNPEEKQSFSVGLEETCHVLKDTHNGEIFTSVLGLVDIMRGTNSYYKMQLLESDNGRQWFVFRA